PQEPPLAAGEASWEDPGGRVPRLSDDAAGGTLTIPPIRPAGVADADALAALHAASWRSGHRGLFKEERLGPSLDGERQGHWRAKLAAMTADDTVLIAGNMGFIAVWAK